MDIETVTEREEVARKNRDALFSVIHSTGVFLTLLDDWRPTIETSGHIDGWNHPFTCLATNGLLGIFVDDQNNAELRHVGNFHWDKPLTITIEDSSGNEVTRVMRQGPPPTRYSSQRKTKPAAPKRLSASERALKLLQDLKKMF